MGSKSSPSAVVEVVDGSGGGSQFFTIRYLILAVGLLGLTAFLMNVLLINTAFICMGNGTYSTAEKSSIISSVAIGNAIGLFPATWALQRFGARWMFFAAGVLSAVATCAQPMAVDNSFQALLLSRIAQGIAGSVDLGVAGTIIVQWAPLKQSGTFMGVLMLFGPFAFAFANPLVGTMCSSSFRWQGAYYLQALVTLVVFVGWLIVYRDDVHQHPLMSYLEVHLIEEGKTPKENTSAGAPPYLRIFTNPSVIVSLLSLLVDMTAAAPVLFYTPIYLHSVLGFSVSSTAWLSILGPALHAVAKFAVGIASDTMPLSQLCKLRLFNSISTFGVGLALVGAAFAPNRTIALISFTASCVFLGAHAGGFFKCAALVARQYTDVVLSAMQLAKIGGFFLGPAIVAALTESDEDVEGWRLVFVATFVLLSASGALFFAVASSEPAHFTRTPILTSSKAAPH